MQINPRSDYPVRVRPRSWDEDSEISGFYNGVYDVTLNQMITITFVPEFPLHGRPFDRASLPADLDDIANAANARLEAVLHADRAVTTHADRAGTNEALPIPAWDDGPHRMSGRVFYVSPDEFAALAEDLEALATEHGDLHSDTLVSSLRGHPAIDFVERLIMDPSFGEHDLSYLRDPAGSRG